VEEVGRLILLYCRFGVSFRLTKCRGCANSPEHAMYRIIPEIRSTVALYLIRFRFWYRMGDVLVGWNWSDCCCRGRYAGDTYSVTCRLANWMVSCSTYLNTYLDNQLQHCGYMIDGFSERVQQELNGPKWVGWLFSLSRYQHFRHDMKSDTSILWELRLGHFLLEYVKTNGHRFMERL
jgi:hypothetical protein